MSILTGERQSCQIWRENVIGKLPKVIMIIYDDLLTDLSAWVFHDKSTPVDINQQTKKQTRHRKGERAGPCNKGGGVDGDGGGDSGGAGVDIRYLKGSFISL